jgi:lipid-A-disaccharide synthase-like uncharacterized protein
VKQQRPSTLLVLSVLAMVGALAVAAPEGGDQPRTGDALEPVELRIKPLPPDVRKVLLEADGRGGHVYVLSKMDGTTERVRPDDFASRLHGDSQDRGWFMRLLNITSPVGIAWVALGLLGQVLFTGRMVLQWLVSEHHRRSVVPVGFWWMSLGGATMLMIYFVWRRDIVGVLGQSTGWFIYARNLWLIYRPAATENP